jgi:hypothetical protein
MESIIEENNNTEVVDKIELPDYERYIYDNQTFGLCPECNRPNTFKNWCKECNSKKFKQNFDNWTSGNKQIDKFIQESQLNARIWSELLEWVPYDRLRNIKYLAQGGFSTIYRAIWLDGSIHFGILRNKIGNVLLINVLNEIIKMQIILKLKILSKLMKNMDL